MDFRMIVQLNTVGQRRGEHVLWFHAMFVIMYLAFFLYDLCNTGIVYLWYFLLCLDNRKLPMYQFSIVSWKFSVLICTCFSKPFNVLICVMCLLITSIRLQPPESLFLCWNVAARGSTAEQRFFGGWQGENWFSWSKINAVMNRTLQPPFSVWALPPRDLLLSQASGPWGVSVLTDIFSGFFHPESRPWMLSQQCTRIHRQMHKQHLGSIWRDMQHISWTGLGIFVCRKSSNGPDTAKHVSAFGSKYAL